MIVRRCLAPLAILATTIVLSAPAVAFAQPAGCVVSFR